HTRFSRDWSSDVCSSDLEAGRDARARRGGQVGRAGRIGGKELELLVAQERCGKFSGFREMFLAWPTFLGAVADHHGAGDEIADQIGRAACRDRVWSARVR